MDVDDIPPVTLSDLYTGYEEMVLVVDAVSGVLANDTDDLATGLVAYLLSTTNSGTLQLSGDGSFVYDPDVNVCGTDNFSYYAFDGINSGATTLVTIQIVCINDIPAVSDASGSVAENALT
ncbi:MAG: cadherin-like domain-containing protein [Candidatus Peribacteria bacterium]|nr:MAG: cadherin-like domain-containing protein [Candidatus Peribacteria bacterium]